MLNLPPALSPLSVVIFSRVNGVTWLPMYPIKTLQGSSVGKLSVLVSHAILTTV